MKHNVLPYRRKKAVPIVRNGLFTWAVLGLFGTYVPNLVIADISPH